MSSDQPFTVKRCPGCGAGDLDVACHPGFGDSPIVRCRACVTEWCTPQPSDERLTEIYSPEYYEPWHLESPDALRAMKAKTFQPLIDQIEGLGATTVLDVGCATAEFLRALQRPGVRSYGVDLDTRAIDDARASLPDVTFHAGTLADVPFDGVEFDAITMIDFIEHVRDPEAELRRAGERLAPGGQLLISTPRSDSTVARVTRRFWPQYREEHLTYFSRAGLAAALQRAGLVAVSSRATRKAVTPAYIYGQAMAYPLPVVTPMAEAMWTVLPLDRLGPLRLWFGEMTVIAERHAAPAGGTFALMLPVAVLAGGLGTRVRHRTGDSMPKAMLPIAGRPFIDHKLEELRAGGASRVLMLVGHGARSIIDHVGDGRAYGLEVDFVYDPPGLVGTGGAIQRALPQLGDAFLVTYGDTLLKVPMERLERRLLQGQALGVMTVLENEDKWETSNVDVNKGWVTTYERVSPPGTHRFIDYGMLALRAEAFVDEPTSTLDLSVVIQELISTRRMRAMTVMRRFYDIGNETSILETEKYLLQQVRSSMRRAAPRKLT